MRRSVLLVTGVVALLSGVTAGGSGARSGAAVATTPAMASEHAVRRLARAAILFTSGREGRPALYTVNSDGSGLRRVVAEPSQFGPSASQWSPDGTTIAFQACTGGRCDIHVVDPAGRHLRRLDTRGEAWGFTWSPDGRKIAYASRDGIFVVPARGRGPIRLTHSPPGRTTDGNPKWSPDGRRIAFLRAEGTCVATCALWVMTPDGTRQWRIAPRADAALDWSPDGQRLVYAAPDRSSGDVFVVNANGSGKRRLIRDASGSLKWSPRNDAIALSGTVGGRKGLFVVRPDGRRLRTISSSYSIYGGAPAWSSDGTRLAIVSPAPELDPTVTGYVSMSGDLYVVEVVSGRARRITEGWRYNYANQSPQWHPRGFRTDRLGGTRVLPGIPTDSVVDGETLRARRPIERLAADGSSVVLHYPWEGASDCLESWDPLAPSLVRYLPGRCDLVDLGLGGNRMAWVIYDGGSHGSALATMTTDLAVPAIISGVCDPYLPGPPIPCYRLPMFDLLGDGPLLVFDTWGGVDCNDWPYCLSAPKIAGSLWRLEGSHAVRIASSAGGLTPLSVDDGRILVNHGAGELEVLAADGTSLRTFQLNAVLLRGARLQGRDLVVLTPSAVEVTDAETGEFVGRWPSPSADARLVDVQDGIAVLVAGREVELLRLSDGRRAVLRPPGTGPVLAQLEPGGLFYSYRVDDPSYPGRVEFVSRDSLGELFG